MANCICEWWKKSMGYNFVPECNHLCQTTVCWDPEILLPWQCDIVTSPVYWLSCKQSSLDKQVWWFSRRWYIKLTFILKHCSFDVGRPQVQVPAWPLAVFVSPLPWVAPTPHLNTTVYSQLVHLLPVAILNLIMAKTSNNRRLQSAGDDDWRSNEKKKNTFAPTLYFCISFTWQMVETCMIRLRGVESRNAHDQIAFCAFHSFLVEVQMNADHIHATQA